jgi:hypothetical protein
VKEFLDNLYKHCVSTREDGVDQLFDVIPSLASEKKFEVLDSILADVDLSRININTMYALIHLTASYIHQLPHYRSTYKKVREEFARRGESSDHIEELFDKYENGWEDRLYDPNAPPYKSPDRRDAERLDAKIAWAKEIGDKELEDYLSFYKSSRVAWNERERKFRQLKQTMGDAEMRKRTIQALRDMADVLDKSTDCWPGIYYCDLPEDPLLNKTFIDGIEVIISYPWPG